MRRKTPKPHNGANPGSGQGTQAAQAEAQPEAEEKGPDRQQQIIHKRIADLTPDPRNANKGNKRGGEMLETSLRDYGAGRSILVDKHGVIIAGNKTMEQAGQIGMEEILVVQTDGTKIVAVQRMDLDLARDPRAVEMALADNRVAQIDLTWDADILKGMKGEIDLTKFWSPSELDNMGVGRDGLAEVPAKVDKAAELQKKWATAMNQTWNIGAGSKLIIADSANHAGPRVDGVLTDPPFEWKAKRVAGIIEEFSDTAVIVGGGVGRINFDMASLWRMRFNLIWRHAKPRHFPGGLLPVMYHSLIAVFTAKDDTPYPWKMPNPNYGSIIETMNDYEDHINGMGKPVELFTILLDGFPWKTVADPFCGTGATIIACEQSSRTCLGYEVDTKMAAVCLQRCYDAKLEIKAGEAASF